MSEETLRWTIGAVRMTALVEAETSGIPPQFFFPDITPDDIRGVGWLGDDPGVADADNATMAMRVQAFVLEVGGRTVLVDPCVGNGKRRNLPFWNDLSTPWLERFHAAGFTEDGIDLVVHTHLHEDHLGWDTRLVDGEWVPTFPGARHLYVAAELDWAAAPEQQAREGSYLDSIEPVLRAGLADIVAPDADLGGGLRLLSTPGHTPGHVSLEVVTGADRFVVSGDLMHHQLQAANPSLAEVGDTDAPRARETRRAFMDDCCGTGALVAGTHFPVAPVGRFEVDGPAAWRFRSVAADA